MEPQGFESLSYDDVVLIVKRQFGPAKHALIAQHIGPVWRASKSMPELLKRLEERLQQSLGSSAFDPAQQALIDKRFRTLVRNELSKKFGSELDLVTNLEEIINDGKSLREIRMKVQFEISRKKINL